MRSVIRASVVSFISLLLVKAVFAFNVEQTQWQRYRTDNDEFSVALPTVPAMRTQNFWLDDIKKSCQVRFIGAYADGIVYAIYVSENIHGEKLENLSSDALSHRSGWDANPDKDINASNVAGRQYLMANKDVAGVAQVFATPQRLYRFEAVGAGPTDPRVRQFFESFSFATKPDGKEVIDGFGEPWRSATSSSDQNRIFTGKEVDRKMFIVAKPDPQYTELARQNRVVGKVVLKAVLSRDGTVEDISVVSGLPDGMTDQVVYTAKLTKFIPAMKDGHFVSTWIQFEYNFSLF